MNRFPRLTFLGMVLVLGVSLACWGAGYELWVHFTKHAH